MRAQLVQVLIVLAAIAVGGCPSDGKGGGGDATQGVDTVVPADTGEATDTTVVTDTSEGTDTDGPPGPTAACAHPLKGHRYAVCGGLSTATVGEPGTAHQALGAVDSTTAPVNGARYGVEGGGFDGER
ncbi:MAG: hypothetical protein H6745_31815 [Deltaproteobacteria bacterium]|nr:hypothetical protein [Deltaproteobacteria bacterium]